MALRWRAFKYYSRDAADGGSVAGAEKEKSRERGPVRSRLPFEPRFAVLASANRGINSQGSVVGERSMRRASEPRKSRSLLTQSNVRLPKPWSPKTATDYHGCSRIRRRFLAIRVHPW